MFSWLAIIGGMMVKEIYGILLWQTLTPNSFLDLKWTKYLSGITVEGCESFLLLREPAFKSFVPLGSGFLGRPRDTLTVRAGLKKSS